MKKIMIVLGVVLAAAMTQAAAIQWKVAAGPMANRLLDYSGNAAFKGTAYLILASDAANFTTQLAKDGTIGTLTTYGSTSSFNAVTGATSATLTSSDSLTSSEQSFALVLVQTVDDKTYYKVSDAMSTTPSANLETDPVLITWTGNTHFKSEWQTYSVPEPTSGLLVLLGMAGLALRRKKA